MTFAICVASHLRKTENLSENHWQALLTNQLGFDKKRRRGVVVFSNSMFDPATDLGFLLLNSEWQDDKRPKVAAFNSRTCADLTGSYQITSNYVIGIRCEADRLFMRGSVHLSTELVPDSKGDFFMRVSGTPVTFVRNDQGKVSGLISYMYGYTTNPMSFTKFSDQPPSMALPSRVPTVASIQSKAYDNYVGQYRIASGKTLTMSHDGDCLVLKSEGQMTLEFYPESETNFFCPYLPIRLRFIENSKGDATGLTVATDLADQEFTGKIWRKVGSPIWILW